MLNKISVGCPAGRQDCTCCESYDEKD
jgi:hypothetical protein